MKNIKDIVIDSNSILIQLSKGVTINDFHMQLINKENYYVGLRREKRTKTQLVYNTENLCNLQTYLRSTSLYKESFLKLLIDVLEKINEIQKEYFIYISIETIFFKGDGTLCFIALPITKEGYEAIDEDVQKMLFDIIKEVQITDAYETIGLLVHFLKMSNFRMLSLLQELHQQLPEVKQYTFFKKFFFHQEPLVNNTYPPPVHNQNIVKREAYVEEIEEPANETMLLFESKSRSGYLENNKKRIPIHQSEFHIGRSPECDYSLNIASISKNHALIIQEEDGFYIKDLKSSNATYINGKKLKPDKLYGLKNNDAITLGNTTMEFHES